MINYKTLEPEQADLKPKIKKVLDHHIDKLDYYDQILEKSSVKDFLNSRRMGTICTLIAMMVKKDEKLFVDDLVHVGPGKPPNLAYLLAAPIVLASHNFD